MEEAIITLANGETLTLVEGQLIFPIIRVEKDGEIFSTRVKPIELCLHVHFGLLPAVTDFLCSCEFFFTSEIDSRAYKSSAVVSVERV